MSGEKGIKREKRSWENMWTCVENHSLEGGGDCTCYDH